MHPDGSSPRGLAAPSASIVLVRVLVDAVEQAGSSRDELLRGTHFDACHLEDASVRVPLDEFENLQARAVALTRDEALGLRMAEQSESSFDLFPPLVSHAPTLREALGLCSQFGRLLKEGTNITLHEQGDTVAIRLHFARVSPLSDRVNAEFALAGLFRLVRGFGGANAPIHSVDFEHARPGYHREHARIFQGVERFSQPSTNIAFASTLLDRAHMHLHSELFLVLRREAERNLDRLARELTQEERLRQYLLAQRPQSMPDMEAAARDLRVSARTLRRRLAEEGVSFRSVVQSVLETLASHMLRDPNRTIQETAHAMGFADAASFHRAFKRWKGVTPKRSRGATDA
jgi:AraC-like DNA-binding protein